MKKGKEPKQEIFLDPRNDDFFAKGFNYKSIEIDQVKDAEQRAMILIAHELGHAVGKLDDPRPGYEGGGVVTLCENEFRRAIGVTQLRTTYIDERGRATRVPDESSVFPGEKRAADETRKRDKEYREKEAK